MSIKIGIRDWGKSVFDCPYAWTLPHNTVPVITAFFTRSILQNGMTCCWTIFVHMNSRVQPTCINFNLQCAKSSILSSVLEMMLQYCEVIKQYYAIRQYQAVHVLCKTIIMILGCFLFAQLMY